MDRVSIHAFRGEGDYSPINRTRCVLCFNPRLPGGRRRRFRFWSARRHRFNPRLPGGRRPTGCAIPVLRASFQSTPSGGKATDFVILHLELEVVSIHAFRGEGDDNTLIPLDDAVLFQSTPSGGKATDDPHLCFNAPRVSIHAFRGEGDECNNYGYDQHLGFNPRLPGGRRRTRRRRQSGQRCFNPRLPGGRRPLTVIDIKTVSAFQSTPSGGKATSICFSFRIRARFNPRLPGGRRQVPF